MRVLRKDAIGRNHYAIGILAGSLILIVELYMNSWRLDLLINSPVLVLLTGLSTSIMKFLSGIGLMLTYASFCSFVFRRTSDMMRNKRQTATYIKTLLSLPVIAIAGYGILKMYTSLFLGESLNLIETLVSLYGVWSVVVTVYVIPVLRSTMQREDDPGIMADVRHRLGRMRYSLWKGYQFRVKKDFGKIYAKEFERYHDRTEIIRGELSGLLLLPMCIVIVIFSPLAGLLFVLWLRILSLERIPLSRGEKALLIITSLTVLLISTLVFLSAVSLPIIKLLDLSYGLGIIGSIILLAYVIVKS